MESPLRYFSSLTYPCVERTREHNLEYSHSFDNLWC
jgi:hypothetical protein